MTDHLSLAPTEESLNAFISRWQKAGGSERANYQLFLTELCELLALPKPDPASDSTQDNAYVFERRVLIRNADGSENNGFIDLYKRGAFVLEAKQTGKTLDTSGWAQAMFKAHNQADQYARALPADEGRPPFILVVDVGRNIELYAEFTRSGSNYTPYPDARSHRLRLEDLRKPEIQERLRKVWLEPLALDPSRHSAKVTRDIADQLAKLAKSLEGQGHSPQLVAGFLMRCLFTMFAEDVSLLPERGFTDLLERLKSKPQNFVHMLENLWQTMNTGGFSPILESTLLKFNGGLFAEHYAIPLNQEQLELLLAASKADWKFVEPAIFGTLLERALNPRERHKLGAHYTPRAYVERLVLPTVIEPLRTEWENVKIASLTYESLNKHKEAVEEVKAFQRHLCEIRVLDPACGSGNFLYVTLEHMKRLEGEVLGRLNDLGQTDMLDTEGLTVDPHQFLGLEINPRAARIAEMVLWIGYLQWHYRTHGKVNPPEPVLRDFKNIECRDALISYEREEVITDEAGKPLTRWDGVTYKKSPITGEDIPDESATALQYRYVNPKKAEWPQADYIVGNPPFIGASTMRRALGDGYVDAVRSTWKEVPESADFVMHWWHIAAEKVRALQAQQFGFITTNSIKQTFNRRIIQEHLEARNPLSLAFAIPDHPWVDAADGAAVRIAMTVGCHTAEPGRLLQVRSESSTNQDEIEVGLQEQQGHLFSDLKIGANVAGSKRLNANMDLSNRGVCLFGSGFIVSPEDANSLGLGVINGLEKHIRHYRNGKDLTQSSRNAMVIDLYGLTAEQVRHLYPKAYQWVLEKVKPERDQNKREVRKQNWWIFGETNPKLRHQLAGLTRYITTVETTKHRTFQLLDGDILPDNMLVNVASEESAYLGILSSRIHAAWALAAGGTLEDRPRYNKSVCFETFPFPDTTEPQKAKIRDLAEKLDAHRKHQQAQHPELTLTGMYNVLEKLRLGETLNAKEKVIHEQGLVSILRELHDELDRAVFAAYGWDDLAEKMVGLPGATTPLPDKSEAQAEAEEELLRRLVALNAERAAEEARGLIRWLRPEYQNPQANDEGRSGFSREPDITEQTEAELDTDEESGKAFAAKAAPTGKATFPKEMREQIAAVRQALIQGPQSAETLAEGFKRKPLAAVQSVLGALEELGMVSVQNGQYQLQS